MKAYDLTNQRFGRLVALYKCDYKKGNKYPWHCICDCGNYTDVPTQDLTEGKVQSCGCLRKENASRIGKETCKILDKYREVDLTNQRFGRLVALENTRQTKNHTYIWKCQCDCGNLTYVRTSDLVSGNTSSCGCLKSKGQSKIGFILRNNNILFEQEKTFSTCINPITQGMLRFDFYVNNQYLIEYDGIQHFKEIEFFNQSLEKNQKYDSFKNQWCFQNNIPLIRIPYTQLNYLCLNDLLLETSQFIVKYDNI